MKDDVKSELLDTFYSTSLAETTLNFQTLLDSYLDSISSSIRPPIHVRGLFIDETNEGSLENLLENLL